MCLSTTEKKSLLPNLEGETIELYDVVGVVMLWVKVVTALLHLDGMH